MTTASERWSGKRIAARVPTQVRMQGRDYQAETRDVSTSGVFLYTASHIEKGSDVELVMILPSELTSGEKCWVCCQATVVRVENDGGACGIAARIRHMEMLPEMAI